MKKRTGTKQSSLSSKLFCLFAACAFALSLMFISASYVAYADGEGAESSAAPAQEKSTSSEVTSASKQAPDKQPAASATSEPAASKQEADTSDQPFREQQATSETTSEAKDDGAQADDEAVDKSVEGAKKPASASAGKSAASALPKSAKSPALLGEPPSYALTIEYDANGGTKTNDWVDSVTIPKSDASMLNTIPVNQLLNNLFTSNTMVTPASGYEFDGVEITSNATGATVTGKPGETVTTDFSQGATIKFLWVKQVVVTFDAKGGTPVPNEQHLRAGEKAAEPTAPSKTGWGTEIDPLSGFDGWYTDETYTNKFDFDTEVTDDVTLYARWNGRLDVEVYDQTSGANLVGGTIACENVEESVTGRTQYGCPWIAEGTKVTLTATPAEGYRFVRWEKPAPDAPVTVSTDATYEFTFTENPTTLYAVFEVKPLTITLVPTTIDCSKPVENYEFEILPGKSFSDVDGTEEYDAAVDHFKTAEGYGPYLNDLYLLPKELSNYTSWDEVEDADLYYYALNEDATYYVAMRKIVTETEIPVTVEAPVCGTETSFVVDNEVVVDPDNAVNMPVVKIESDKVQPYGNSAAKRFWWTTEDATTYGDIFNGRFVGGNKYGVLLQFEPAFGYMFDKNNPATVKVNGTVADTKVYSSSWSIDVIGIVTADHDWDEGVVDPEPTCTEPGTKTFACKHNGEDWHEVDASKTEEVAATGHDWGEWAETKAPTCTEPGEEMRTCKNDASHTETREVAALGHDWGEWTVTKEPAVGVKGERQRVCNRCGEVQTEEIPALDEVTYLITYDPAGGTFRGSTEPISIEYADGQAIKIAEAPTRDGYTFLYWKGSQYQPGDEYTVAANHTFTAVWEKNSTPVPAKKTPAPKTSKAPSKVARTADEAPLAMLGLLAAVALAVAPIARRRMN